MDDALVMDGGRSFYMRAAAASKIQSLTVFNLAPGPTACGLSVSLSAAQCPFR